MKPAIGARFHCLTVTEYCHVDGHGEKIWKCRCDCGKNTFASTGTLNGGRKQSCGCLKKSYREKFKKVCRERNEAQTLDDALEELEAMA